MATAANRLAHEAARRYTNATCLAETLAAIDYGMAAHAEAKRRALRIEARLFPAKQAVHGFYDFDGFIAGSRQNDLRKRAYKANYDRLLGKIIARDELIPAADERLAA